jgi:hypothetical protein
VNDTTPPSVNSPGSRVGNVGQPVSLQLSFTDADTFSDGGTLPPGLNISNTGLISGTPTTANIYNVVITATDTGVAQTTTINFTFRIGAHGPVNTVVLGTDGSLVQFVGGTGAPQPISAAGSIKAVSVTLDSNGGTDIYVITTGFAGAQYNNTLWAFVGGAWSERSSGSFKQISAATSSDGGSVVFGVLTDNSLWEQHLSNGTDTGWTQLSPGGTILSASAVTDGAGNEWCYAIVTTGNNLWLHGPAFPSGWQQLSTGSFQQVSAGLNASEQALMYGVLTSGQLYEQSPAFGPVGLNTGFHLLSGNGSPNMPNSFLSVQAGGPDVMFGIAADKTVWEHTGTSTNTHISSTFLATQLSATQTKADGDDVFMTLQDGELWEYSLSLIPSLGTPFKQLLAGGVASSYTPE